MNVKTFVFIVLCGYTNATDCQNGWVAFEGSCYLLGANNVFFDEAEKYCRYNGAHLVHVESWGENMFLKGYIHGYLKVSDAWIGMTDQTIEGVWMWYGTSTAIQFADWGPNEPRFGDHSENCAVFHHSHDLQWADVPCGTQRHALCEKRGGPIFG